MHRFSPEQIAAMTAWQRRRFERLGLIPAVSSAARAAVDDPPAHPEPTTPTAEHVASGADQKALERALRDSDV